MKIIKMAPSKLSVCSAEEIVGFNGERWKQRRKREILKLIEYARMEN